VATEKIPPDELARDAVKRPVTVRSAARARMPLDGADAQALEGALQQVERELAGVRKLLAESEAATAKLAAFKAYVHKRLDDAGVPEDPEPKKNKEHGCRIEGRLNCLLNSTPINLGVSEKEFFKAVWRERLHAVELLLGSYRLDDAVIAILKGRTETSCGEVLAPSKDEVR